MKNTKLMGALVATAVAGLVLSTTVKAEDAKTAEAAKVKCSGINSCKGSSACKTKDNACKGQNSCHGKGWIEVGTDKECTDKGGTVVKE